MKTNDKKLFTIKNLVSEIQTRHAEQVMGVVTHNIPMPHFQFTYSFADLDVVLDAVNLLTCYVGNSSASSSQDRQKLENFITTFFPLFFGFSSKLLQEPERLLEDGQLEQASTDQASGKTSLARARRTGPQHGQKNGLLRDVLDPNKHTRSNDPDDMVDTPGSESATPSSPGDDSTSVRTISRSASTSPLPTLERWTESLGSSRRIADGQPALSQRSVKRSDYNLYATPTIYGLFRLFQILYFRLLKIKSKELQVREDVNRRMRHKPANDLRLITRGQPETYFSKIGPGATFYPQMLRMIEELVVGTTDASFVEDCLREFYIEDGWRLYTIDKLLLAITRQIIAIVGPEPKEKSGELISLWRQDREKGDHTSYEAEIAYRKYAESFSGNESGQLFRITWATTRNEATIQMVKHDTPTFLQREMNTVEKWSSYMASYELYDATEDIDYDEIIKSKRFPYLKRNVGDARLTTEEYNKLVTVETTVIKIDPVTYRRAFKKGKEVMLRAAPGSAPEGVTPRSPKHSRTLVFRRRFVEKPSWMEGLTEEEIKAKLEAYRRTVEGEEKVAGADEPSGSVANGTGDVEMS